MISMDTFIEYCHLIHCICKTTNKQKKNSSTLPMLKAVLDNGILVYINDVNDKIE